MVKRTRKVDQWGTVPVYVRLDPAVAEKLDSLVASTGGSVKSIVEELISGARVVQVPGTVKIITSSGASQPELRGVILDDDAE